MGKREVSFTVTEVESLLINKIARRAQKCGWDRDTTETRMDLSACHANGCPLDFERLLAADDFNLLHDVCGIARHIDHGTGELMDCFRPRFARKQVEAA